MTVVAVQSGAFADGIGTTSPPDVFWMSALSVEGGAANGTSGFGEGRSAADWSGT